MYAIIQTRLDICFAIIILSRYNYNLNSKYIAIIKRVIRYLKGILNYNIIYKTIINLISYINAD